MATRKTFGARHHLDQLVVVELDNASYTASKEDDLIIGRTGGITVTLPPDAQNADTVKVSRPANGTGGTLFVGATGGHSLAAAYTVVPAGGNREYTFNAGYTGETGAWTGTAFLDS